MARFPLFSCQSWATALTTSLALFTFIVPTNSQVETVKGTNANGVVTTLLADRTPALYTGDFGDCMGGQSLINLTSFDAAYYADNMTVLFNMAGSTSLRNESLMLYISVEAYGENRFNLVFNPCNANFGSLCPLNSSIPITGQALIPVSSADVAGIPNIALAIPDFEGSAVIRVFSNSSQTQIACFSAVMRNGASFAHPAAVGSILGLFTLVAVIASFATAIYGVDVPDMRTHYAHSLSVLVVLEVFQSIFFSGTLSLNWPSVLAAWWSNFAWSAGMIYSPGIIQSLDFLAGISGNSSQVGGAGSTVLNSNGGLQQQIYGRSLEATAGLVDGGKFMASHVYKRAAGNSTDPRLYAWAGVPVSPGLPTPANWSGFAGELSMLGIPAADAFMNGFVWFLIVVLILTGAIVFFKYSLESLSTIRWIEEDRLALFRSQWARVLGLVILRTCFISFSMIMTLTLFQFSYGGKSAPIAIAAIVFLIFFVGSLAISFYACFYRVRFGRYESQPDRIHFQRKMVMKFLPWYGAILESKLGTTENPSSAGSLNFFRIRFLDRENESENVHQNVDYTKRFGWLAARYRRTRWWFFAFWIVYQFVRACFVGGAREHPTAQVVGLFLWEIIAFVAIVIIDPYEGSRNTALAVWMLSISKVVTAGLSISFLAQLKVARIPTTVIGVIIIVVQGFMVIGLLILVVLSAISSYISLSRNHENFKPESWQDLRQKYFSHLEQKQRDVPSSPSPEPEVPEEPYFSVNSVRRAPKIEDEDPDYVPKLHHLNASILSLTRPDPSSGQISRANSMAGSMRSHNSNFGNVPFGARVHGTSWTSREPLDEQEGEISPMGPTSRGGSSHIANNLLTPMAPVVQLAASDNNIRMSTPTRESQQQYASQRINRLR